MSLVWKLLFASLFTASLFAAACSEEGPSVRVPAEWEPHEATWMQWPRELESSHRADFANVVSAIKQFEPVNLLVASAAARDAAQRYLQDREISLDNIVWHIADYDWSWMRDNGPVWAVDRSGLVVQDWSFDGWGDLTHQFSKDNSVPSYVADTVGQRREVYDLINERGTLEFNGVDTLITSWSVLNDRNAGVSQEEMEELFKEAFGVSNVIWLLSGPSDDVTLGHVDAITRFIDEDTVVIPRYVDQQAENAWVYEEAAAIVADAGLEVVRLDVPGSVTYKGVPMSANYANWYVANDAVIMTGFGVPEWDNAAIETLKGFFPGREVVMVETLELWYWGGGVHCITNDQPSG